MEHRSAAVVGALVVVLLHGCATPTKDASVAQAQPAAAASRTSTAPPGATARLPFDLAKIPTEQTKVTLQKIQQVQRSYPAWRATAATPGYRCKIDPQGNCRIRVDVFQARDVSLDLDYCIGIAPEFVVIEGKGAAKQIVWELQLIDPRTNTDLPWSSVQPAGSTLDFLGDGDHGILVFQNIFEGGNPNRPQLKDGKRGSPGNLNEKNKFNIKNEHKENGTAKYLPIIVHTVAGVPGLCGTPDPIIYNVN